MKEKSKKKKRGRKKNQKIKKKNIQKHQMLKGIQKEIMRKFERIRIWERMTITKKEKIKFLK